MFRSSMQSIELWSMSDRASVNTELHIINHMLLTPAVRLLFQMSTNKIEL